MRSQSTLWLVLWLMVTLPLSGMAQPSSTGPDFDVNEQASEATAVSEEERLARAACFKSSSLAFHLFFLSSFSLAELYVSTS